MQGCPCCGPPPFPVPLECPRARARATTTNLGDGNVRLPLRADHHADQQVRVQTQIDVLDNTMNGLDARTRW